MQRAHMARDKDARANKQRRSIFRNYVIMKGRGVRIFAPCHQKKQRKVYQRTESVVSVVLTVYARPKML
jgi:hypothetical protein